MIPLSERIIRLEARHSAPEGLSCVCMFEIGLVVLSIACFVILDLYIVGCEKV